MMMLKTGCQQEGNIIPGAERTDLYLNLLSGKRVAIVANQTSMIGQTHLVDSLVFLGIDIRRIFSPEHGFRGDQDDGALVSNGADIRTGIPIKSLYQESKKPDSSDLNDVDLIIYDIQDVGLRFYTFISTLHYVMQACAENGKPLLVLDRPNPNGFYTDGPILEPEFRSFVGMHEVPVVYGMTIGEYARMINGEGWIGDTLFCDLKIIPCHNYTHDSKYHLPIKPSPNLPNMNSIYLYPSTCFFEGTVVTEGRGTDYPFEIFGHPDLQNCSFTFTPESKPGAATNPRYLGEKCYGVDLREYRLSGDDRPGKIDLSWVIFAYNNYPDKENFFTSYFEKLAGTATLREQIIAGMTAEAIRETWKEGLEEFQQIREKYLLYPDFGQR
ncbi:MAG: hypothetical protein AMS27_13565 [Bacteroides sp. SM23_62_1]|nr:MAG: hypothetical protein AMS27_13565 [Bacteroides sp. SM23_62_1]